MLDNLADNIDGEGGMVGGFFFKTRLLNHNGVSLYRCNSRSKKNIRSKETHKHTHSRTLYNVQHDGV